MEALQLLLDMLFPINEFSPMQTGDGEATPCPLGGRTPGSLLVSERVQICGRVVALFGEARLSDSFHLDFIFISFDYVSSRSLKSFQPIIITFRALSFFG